MVMYILFLSVCILYLNGMTLTEAAGYEWVIRSHSLCTEFGFIILFADIMSVLRWTVSNQCVSCWVHYNLLAQCPRHRGLVPIKWTKHGIKCSWAQYKVPSWAHLKGTVCSFCGPLLEKKELQQHCGSAHMMYAYHEILRQARPIPYQHSSTWFIDPESRFVKLVFRQQWLPRSSLLELIWQDFE